jgi:hypothetical protein
LALNQDYLCCVPSSEVIPSYKPQTNTGGCSIATSQIIQFAVLWTLQKAATIVSTGTATDDGEYRLAIQPSKILKPFAEAQMFTILLTSALIHAINGRSLLLDLRKIAKADISIFDCFL